MLWNEMQTLFKSFSLALFENLFTGEWHIQWVVLYHCITWTDATICFPLSVAVSKSDCYVTVTLPTATARTCRTKTIENCNNPKWNETFTMRVPKNVKVSYIGRTQTQAFGQLYSTITQHRQYISIITLSIHFLFGSFNSQNLLCIEAKTSNDLPSCFPRTFWRCICMTTTQWHLMRRLLNFCLTSAPSRKERKKLRSSP